MRTWAKLQNGHTNLSVESWIKFEIRATDDEAYQFRGWVDCRDDCLFDFISDSNEAHSLTGFQ